jgi:hypothetical protein
MGNLLAPALVEIDRYEENAKRDNDNALALVEGLASIKALDVNPA